MMARDREESRRSSRDDSGFTYKRRSADDMKKRASEKSGNFSSFIKGDFKKYKMKDGKNLIRILPPTWDHPKHYGYTIFLNYKIGADNQTFLSLSAMGQGKDPLAEARQEAQRDGDKDMAKALNPQKRSLMWVIDRMDEDEGPQLFDCPFGVDTDFVTLAIDEDTKEVIYVDDPDEGSDIRFYREPGKPFPKYPPAKMKILAPSPLSEDKGQKKEWLDFVKDNPVPDCLHFYDYDHIQAAFDGVIGSYDEDAKNKVKDEDEDEKPARKRPARDEDEDDVKPARRVSHDADEDEEQEAKPARRSRQKLEDDDEDGDDKPAKGKAEDDEEEAEADDEAEADEKPVKGIRARLAERRSKRPTADDD